MADARVTQERHRFDAVRLAKGVLKEDPYTILAASRELVARRGELGDMIIVHCPPGAGPKFFDRMMKFLEKEGGGRQQRAGSLGDGS